MATELAKAYVQILPSADGMTNNLKEVMGGPAEKAGSDAGARLGTAIKKAISAIGIGTTIKQAITEGMDLEQNLGGTEAVFGDFAASIQETAKTAYKNMGTSASEYMATANKMGALFQGSGLQQQESLDLTAKAMQRAADVASVMGIDTSMALESIAGAAKGNFTMMDNLGVAMNATTLQAYALEKGINFEWNTASNAEKAQLAMQMFFERTEQYAENFARESEETLSGSMGAVKAALQDVLGNMALGENVAPSLAALKTTIINFANNLLPALANVITTIPAAAMQVVVAILPGLIETGIQAANGMLQGFAEAIPNVALNIALMIPHIVEAIAEGVPQLLEGGGSILNAILEGITQTMPILVAQLPMIVTAITECLSGSIDIILAAATQLFDAVVQAIPIIIPPLLEAIPEIIETIVSFLTSNVQTIVDAAVQMNYGIINAIPIIIDALIPELPHIIWTITEALIDAQPKILSAAVQALLSIIGAVPKVLGSLLDAMGSVGSNLVKGLWNGISDVTGWVLDKIKGFGKSVLNGIKSIFGIHSPSTEMAWMGKMLDQGLADGITDNLHPIRSAMDEVTQMTTGSVESRLAMSVSGDMGRPAETDAGLGSVITLLEMLVMRLQKMQVVLDSGEVVGWVDTGLRRSSGKQERGVV